MPVERPNSSGVPRKPVNTGLRRAGQSDVLRRGSINSIPSIGIRRQNSSLSVHSARRGSVQPDPPGNVRFPSYNAEGSSQAGAHTESEAESESEHEPQPSPQPPVEVPDRYSSIDFATRRRSSSEPRRSNTVPSRQNDYPPITRSSTRPDTHPETYLPTLTEEVSQPSIRRATTQGGGPSSGIAHRKSIASRLLHPRGGNNGTESKPAPTSESGGNRPNYDAELVDLLDVIDPEVSTLSTLTNVQNSLFVPDLGRWINRRPTYSLTAVPTRPDRTAPPERPKRPDTLHLGDDDLQEKLDQQIEISLNRRQDSELATITSRLSESHYAVLPHGVSLEGWTDEEKAELEDHVRHMLHSRRAAFKRGMKGFGQYVRRPLGFFVTLYATLITLFGFAWVLFLIGWVNLGARRDYIINVIDNVLVALFAVMGDGLIPFRIVDTYHMCYIAHYHHLTWNIRKKMHMPELPNENDLPQVVHPAAHNDSIDLEALRPTSTSSSANSGHPDYYSVLTEAQQRKLEHHQAKFAKSHTFYKPHETETHFAFPLRLLVAIVTILDFHSIFQVALGTCTWAIPYKTRPFSLTTVILCFSICCNITGGIMISVGDRKTRKKEVRERMFRQQLTEDAIKDVQKNRRKESGLEAVPEVKDNRMVDEILEQNRQRRAAHL